MKGLTILSESISTQQIILIVVVVLLLAALIVLPMFTNKKRQKAITEMHNSISVGDTVKTVGGIVGKIVAINDVNAVDKEFVLETGLEGSKTTMVFDFNAIYQVMAKVAKPVAPVEVQPEENAIEAVETPVAEDVKPAEHAEVSATDEKAEEKAEQPPIPQKTTSKSSKTSKK